MYVLLGVVIGLFVGAVAGDLPGAAAGTAIGALIGTAVQRAMRPPQGAPAHGLAETEQRIDHIYRALEHIHYRLEEIERRVGSMPRPMAVAGTAPPEAPASPAPGAARREAEQAVEWGRPVQTPDVLTRSANASVPADASASAEGTASARPAAAAKARPQASNAAAAPAWQRWLFGGNTMVRVGVVVLFFGVAFLAKYAAETFTLPIELRLAGIALGGAILFAIGWRLRHSRPGYGLSLQGGGVGILYLTVFAAFRLYDVLSAPTAFALLLGLVAASGVLAVRQESLALAMLGAAGGFMAPVLASTGRGSHVMLFGYYALLNAGILGIAWTRAWRPLNLLGFVFTFVIAAMWGARFYRPEHFATTEPFLLLFFLMYVGIAVLHATRRSLEIKHYVDGTLVFGTPLVAIALQGELVRGIPYGLAWSAFALALFYLALAASLRARRDDSLQLLYESFLGLGVAFLTLAIPFALDGRWTSAAWAVEGAAVVWASSRQGRRIGQWFGVALQPAAAVALLDAGPVSAAHWPLANPDFLGAAFLAAAGVFCGRVIARRPESFGSGAAWASPLLLLWGAAWALGGAAREVDRFVVSRYHVPALVGVIAAWGAAFLVLRRRAEWRAALAPTALLLPLMVAVAAMGLFALPHPFARGAWIGWMSAFAVVYALLRLHEDELPGWAMRATHLGAGWLALALLGAEAMWLVDRVVHGGAWPFAAAAIVPVAALAAVTSLVDRTAWPLDRHRGLYAVAAAAPVALLMWVGIFIANAASDGTARPLAYLPIVNPLDAACLAALVAMGTWYAALHRRGLAARVAPVEAGIAIGVAAFAWANGALLRTLHHWAGIPYELDDMLRSNLAQTSISVFWTVLAVAVMLFATRSARRGLWLTGALLLGVVVVKLFIFDLSQLAGLERIVSFLAVGLLLLAIGWFSPVPPRKGEPAAGEPAA